MFKEGDILYWRDKYIGQIAVMINKYSYKIVRASKCKEYSSSKIGDIWSISGWNEKQISVLDNKIYKILYYNGDV